MIIKIDWESSKINTKNVVNVEWQKYCKQKKGYLYRLTIYTNNKERTFWFHSWWKSKYYYWVLKYLKRLK